eukprot:TRINITY_DN8874_c0_g1_i1.p1 TRINITY_DN8874_c0_g1~~TRINITY_DN8874_c0_g1_i1.p1  ORF type:complete len:1177 (+),score=169.30 TRINITY_DN8874_c0_g1_i1:71-3601(+)
MQQPLLSPTSAPLRMIGQQTHAPQLLSQSSLPSNATTAQMWPAQHTFQSPPHPNSQWSSQQPKHHHVRSRSTSDATSSVVKATTGHSQPITYTPRTAQAGLQSTQGNSPQQHHNIPNRSNLPTPTTTNQSDQFKSSFTPSPNTNQTNQRYVAHFTANNQTATSQSNHSNHHIIRHPNKHDHPNGDFATQPTKSTTPHQNPEAVSSGRTQHHEFLKPWPKPGGGRGLSAQQSVIYDHPEDFKYPPNGKMIRKYKLIKTLGCGGFALVKKALDTETKQFVAIKIFLKASETFDPRLVANEVAVMKQFSHPNIVKFISAMEDQKYIYLVMEYADGGDLLRLAMKSGRMQDDMARHIFSQIVAAVSHMKSQNVTHRDLKLENILLCSSPELTVKLSDFGMVGITDRSVLLRTICGTPVYNPPEILDNKPCEGPPLDVWSLGVILYSLLCGNFPFDDLDDINMLYAKIRTGTYPTPQCSRMAKDLISKMLVVNPSARATIQEISNHPWLQQREQVTITREVVLQRLRSSYHSPIDERSSLYRPLPAPLLPPSGKPSAVSNLQDPKSSHPTKHRTRYNHEQDGLIKEDIQANDRPIHVPLVEPILVPAKAEARSSLGNNHHSASHSALTEPSSKIHPVWGEEVERNIELRRFWAWQADHGRAHDDDIFSDSDKSEDESETTAGASSADQSPHGPRLISQQKIPEIHVIQDLTIMQTQLASSSISTPTSRQSISTSGLNSLPELLSIKPGSGRGQHKRTDSGDLQSLSSEHSNMGTSPTMTNTPVANTAEVTRYRRSSETSDKGSGHGSQASSKSLESSNSDESNISHADKVSKRGELSRIKITRKLTKEWPAIEYANNHVPVPCYLLLLKMQTCEDNVKLDYANHFLVGLESCVHEKKNNEEWMFYFLNSVLCLSRYFDDEENWGSAFRSIRQHLHQLRDMIIQDIFGSWTTPLDRMLDHYMRSLAGQSFTQERSIKGLECVCELMQKKTELLLRHRLSPAALGHWFLYTYRYLNAVLANGFIRHKALCTFSKAADVKGQVSLLVMWLFDSLPRSLGLDQISAQLGHVNEIVKLLTTEKTIESLLALQISNLTIKQQLHILHQFEPDYIDADRIPENFIQRLIASEPTHSSPLEMPSWDLRLWTDYPQARALPSLDETKIQMIEPEWLKWSILQNWINLPAI